MAIGSTTAPPAAHSKSTIAIEEVHGSHVLTVTGYTRTKWLAVGESMRSATFAVGGHRWCIKYYPNGDTQDNAGYVSLYLVLVKTDAPDAKARFGIRLLDTRSKAVTSYGCNPCSTNMCTFSLKGGSTGWSRFIKRTTLEKSPELFFADSFRVRCSITVLKEVIRDDTVVATAAAPVLAKSRLVEVPPPEMDRQLGHLLSSGEGADVAFEVGGETVAAHRSILAARSPVFKAELFGPAKLDGTGCVWVEDMEASVFKAMLHFVYTDSLPEVEDGETTTKNAMAMGLLAAADRYGLERLKLMCEDKLCDGIDTGSVGTVLALAEKHGCQGLKKACLDFLMSGSNLKAAILSGGLEHLTSSYPSVLKELLAKVAL